MKYKKKNIKFIYYFRCCKGKRNIKKSDIMFEYVKAYAGKRLGRITEFWGDLN